MRPIAIALLLLAVAPASIAQDKDKDKGTDSATANPIVATVRAMEQRYSKNLIGAADEMPAAKYSYKPTPDQITFGHLVIHIAQSNNGLCAAIAGEPARETKLSETDSKDVLTKALQDSFTYCEQVLAKADDSTLGQSAVLSGGHTITRGAALVHLSADWADHYGAAAMYLRLNDLLPPSAKKPAGK
jgi:uncharacterized damage-inducible protein DinB